MSYSFKKLNKASSATTTIGDMSIYKMNEQIDTYTELDYVQSNGTQFIDSGIMLNNSQMKAEIVAELMTPTVTSTYMLFGTQGDTTSYFQLFTDRTNNIYMNCGDYNNVTSLRVDEGVSGKVTFSLEYNNGTYTVVSDQTTKTGSCGQLTDTTHPIYIFARNATASSGNNYNSSYKLYEMKIYANNTLVRYFKPVKRNSDNRVGLYDEVTNRFYSNTIGDALIAGEIPSPSYDPVFGNNTPAQIAAASAEIATQNMSATDVYNTYGWNLGDTVDITLKNNEQIQMQIIGVNHDTLSSDHTSKVGLTLQMVNCLATRYPMNNSNTNAGGWNGSLMRTSTMPTLLALLPDEWQGVIKTVDKKAANGGSTNYSATVTTSDDLFLLCEKEIFGSAAYAAQDGANEGTQYAYWASHNTANDRIKYYDNAGQQTATSWWERSSLTYYPVSFCNVFYNGGNSNDQASLTRGVAFAFCV